MPHRINIDQLNSLVSSGKKLLVKFSAEWCGQSKMAALLIEKVKQDYPDIEFVEIDVDDHNLWDNDTLKIKLVPTFVGYHNRQTVFNESDYQIEEDLRKLLDELNK